MKKVKMNHILTLAALMAIATACKKDPSPEPTPTDMHKKIVLLWDWYFDGAGPRRDTVKYYADSPMYDTILLIPDSTSVLSEYSSRSYTTWNFHRARDTLQKSINFAPHKIRGAGTIHVNGINGAHLPPDYEVETTKPGMSLEDSIWYTSQGWRVVRGNGNTK